MIVDFAVTAAYWTTFAPQDIIVVIQTDVKQQQLNAPPDFFVRYLPQATKDIPDRQHIKPLAGMHTHNANARQHITARQVRQRNTASQSTVDAMAKQSAARLIPAGANVRQIPQAPQVKRLAPAPPGIQSAVDGAPRRARQQPAVH